MFYISPKHYLKLWFHTWLQWSWRHIGYSISYYQPKQEPCKIPLYRKANLDMIRWELSDFSNEYFYINSTSVRTVDENWSFFLTNFQNIINDIVPLRIIHQHTHPPWMTNEFIYVLLKRKRESQCTIEHYRRNSDRSEYKVLQHKVRHMLKHNHRAYITNIMSSSKNSKLFWQYMKAKKQDSTGIPTLNSLDGEAITEPTEKANVLNEILGQFLLLKN